MYRSLSKIYPSKIRDKYKDLLKYSDAETDHEQYIGTNVAFGLIISLLTAAILSFFMRIQMNTAILVFVFAFVLIEIIGYLLLILKADAKGKFIEEILPDALLLMSMNIKSGMTTDRSLIMSARSEFGPLERELNKAGKQILAGKEVRYALLDMTTRIRSDLFERTIRLIVEGIESGGELSSLLQQTAEDIQNTKLVHNEVRSNLMMYSIFIFFAVGFGAPLLFGISTYLVGSVGTQIASVQAANQPGAATMHISTGFLVIFALLSLTITSFFGGLIIGIIKSGSEKAGIKLIPILIIVSFLVFFVVRGMVSSIFPAFP
jgi:hypothetical protein